MSPTTISPSLGEGLAFLQAGVGSAPGYSAITVRRALSAGLQEGVVDSGSLKVTTGSSGLNLSIAASTGDGAYVLGDSVASQALYYVAPHSGAITETATAADATNPRIDTVILEALDDTHAGGGSNLGRVRIVAGTPTAGATLENRSGAPSLPTSAIRLADILVPALFTGPFVNATHIRDRRPWARGAFWRGIRTAGNLTISSASYSEMDSTNMKPRLECSGAPLRMMFHGSIEHGTAGGRVDLRPQMDGAVIDSMTDLYTMQIDTANGDAIANLGYTFTPTAASHQFGWAFKTASGTATAFASSTQPLVMTVEEIVRQNASND